jgi:hypothetical protein
MTVRVTFEAPSLSALKLAVAAFFEDETERLNHTGVPAADEPVRRGRGRPPGSGKKAEPTATADEFPAETALPPVTPSITAKIPADPPPMVSTMTPPPTPPLALVVTPEPLPGAAVLDVSIMRKTLIEVVKRFGRDECGKLCRAHGGPNLTSIPESAWPGLYADAQKLLAQPAE